MKANFSTKLLIIVVGMSLSNFILQWLYTDPNWAIALDRSMASGIALFNFWIMEKFFWEGK